MSLGGAGGANNDGPSNNQGSTKTPSVERLERDSFRAVFTDLVRSSHGVNGLTMDVLDRIVTQVMAALAAEFAPPQPPSDKSDLDS